MSHAEATFRAVDPLAVAVIEPAFRAALMLGGRPPPLEALRGLAADRPTVGLPPPAGPTDGEHRPAPRPAAAHRAPPRGSGAHAGPPRRRRRVRRRRGGTGETDRPAGADGGASPGELRSRVHGSRCPRDRTSARRAGQTAVGGKISARASVGAPSRASGVHASPPGTCPAARRYATGGTRGRRSGAHAERLDRGEHRHSLSPSSGASERDSAPRHTSCSQSSISPQPPGPRTPPATTASSMCRRPNEPESACQTADYAWCHYPKPLRLRPTNPGPVVDQSVTADLQNQATCRRRVHPRGVDLLLPRRRAPKRMRR